MRRRRGDSAAIESQTGAAPPPWTHRALPAATRPLFCAGKTTFSFPSAVASVVSGEAFSASLGTLIHDAPNLSLLALGDVKRSVRGLRDTVRPSGSRVGLHQWRGAGEALCEDLEHA